MQTADDPFKLETLIAWAEKQPADKRYDYWCNRCYFGQYFEAHGHQVRMVGTASVTFNDGETRHFPAGFFDVAFEAPHTFGAALERARKLSQSS